MRTDRIEPLLPAAFAGAAAALLAGCQLAPQPVLDRWPPPQGEWQVVSHKSPGIAPMSPVAAAKYVGGTVTYGAAGVVSGPDRCTAPSYVVSSVYAETYLYRQYGVRTADLGLYPYQDVRVTEVFCDGRKWPGLGGHVIWTDPDRGYAIRDGVWFELRRPAAPPR